jgi:hypothetical protein
MTRDFFDPTPEQQNVVLIDVATLPKATARSRAAKPAARMPKFRSTRSSIA